MQLGISIAFDQSYSCRTCELTDMDLDDDLDHRTWQCNACGKPVDIHLENEDGGSQLVQRRPACELEEGDFIFLEYDISRAAEVMASQPALGRGNKWYLALSGIGYERVERSKYYNCIIRG